MYIAFDMSTSDQHTFLLHKTVDELADTKQMPGLYHPHRHGDPLPSTVALEEIIALGRAVLFPGFYGRSSLHATTIKYHNSSPCSPDKSKPDSVLRVLLPNKKAAATVAAAPKSWLWH